MREVVNAIFYVLRGGIPWRMLPHDLPPWQTVYHYFRLWRIDGRWEELNRILRQRLRVRMDREATPSAGIMDSQSARTTEKWGPRGYDGGKKVKGRKRHLLVDTQGLIIKTKVHPADPHDKEGAKLLLSPLAGKLPRMAKV
jgi:putative transposase